MPKTTNHLTQSTEINIGFIHGWGMNSGAFAQLIHTLEHQLLGYTRNAKQRVNLYTITLPGHGDSQLAIPEQYDLPTIANAVSPQVKPNSILVAWSLGGLVAQYLACNQHPNLRALMTIASTPKFQMADEWPGIKPDVLNMFMTQLKQNHHKTLTRFLAIQMMGVENAKQLIKEISSAIDVYPAPDIQALSKGLEILQHADIRDDIKHINVPTLRTYGRLDSLVPYAAINKIQHLQPNSRHLIFKHASHAPFLTNALAFSTHIIDFVDEVSSLSD